MKGTNNLFRENVKKLTLELNEAKKGQVEVMESYSRCKKDLHTDHSQLQFALKDARVAFQKWSRGFSKLQGLRCLVRMSPSGWI